MTKAEVLAEIRRTAADNGGVPLGKRRFFAATGIRESDWSGRWWTTWGAAVREAGLEPQGLNPPFPDETILEAAARITLKLGRFPTAAEIRFETNAPHSSFPSHNTFRRFGGLGGLRNRLWSFARERGLTQVVSLLGDAEESSPLETSTPSDPSGLPDGFVYLIKSGRHYKIGRAASVDKRHRQLRIQLPQASEVVHRIKTDDPPGIEAYWHNRFADKRLNGEWFALSAEDVKQFRRRKFM